MPTLRESLKRRVRWIILGCAVILLGVAALDWRRPPAEQKSLLLYHQAVIVPYRTLVRPVTHRFVQCRYVPTCSQYSTEAIAAHGFPKGLWLTIKRLCRCGPWVKFGTFDPVPPPPSA